MKHTSGWSLHFSVSLLSKKSSRNLATISARFRGVGGLQGQAILLAPLPVSYQRNGCHRPTSTIFVACFIWSWAKCKAPSIKVQSPYWMESLRCFQEQCETSAISYECAAGWRMLRKQGTDVVTGVIHYIAGVAHINEDHWVSYILDGGSGTILVGDSLLEGGEAALECGGRAKIINSLRWWMHQSWGLVVQTPHPIPSSSLLVQQQQDSSSCRIYAFNSIATFFKPKAHPRLALSSLRSTRAKFFNGIVEHHHSMQVFSAKIFRITRIQNTNFTLGFRFSRDSCIHHRSKV